MNSQNRDRETLQQEYDHLMLRIAFCELQDEELGELLADQAADQPGIELEEAFFQQTEPGTMQLFQENLHKRQIRHTVKQGLPKLLRAAAAMLLIFYISLTVAMAVSPAVRVRVMELFFQDRTVYTEVELMENPEKSFEVPAEWTGDYFPAYIPDGFAVDYIYSGIAYSSFTAYVRDQKDSYSGDERIDFSENNEDAYSNIDTENAEVEMITVNGASAMLITKNTRYMLVWSFYDRYFILTTYNISLESTLQIAQSVERIK